MDKKRECVLGDRLEKGCDVSWEKRLGDIKMTV